MMLSLLLKATVTLALGLVAAGALRRSRASVRHAILAATLGALLVLPLATVLAASFPIPVAVPALPPTLWPPPLRDAPPTDPIAAAGGRSAPSAPRPSRQASPDLLALYVWMAGAATLLASLAGALWRLDRLKRTALPAPALADAAKPLARAAGIQRDVDILCHAAVPAPVTCGFFRPVILLPLDAEQWHPTSLRSALVHELAHVARVDWPIQLLARVARALYWFHPLVWIVQRRLRLEAERASDDAVLVMAERTGYAEQLVALARRIAGPHRAPTITMADRSDLAARVAAILDAGQTRGRAGAGRVAMACGAMILVVLALSPLHLAAVTRHEGDLVGDAQARSRRSGGARRLDRALLKAADDGDVEEMMTIIEAGADIDGVIAGDGSPLIAAARHGHLQGVRLLLDRGADPNLAVLGDGNPLIMAAREGHIDIVATLLDRGGDVNQFVPEDENALIQASGAGHLEVAQLLVARGADVNARAWAGGGFERGAGEWRTPLSMARQGGHHAVVAFLMSRGARE